MYASTVTAYNYMSEVSDVQECMQQCLDDGPDCHGINVVVYSDTKGVVLNAKPRINCTFVAITAKCARFAGVELRFQPATPGISSYIFYEKRLFAASPCVLHSPILEVRVIFFWFSFLVFHQVNIFIFLFYLIDFFYFFFGIANFCQVCFHTTICQ